jgi:hypothetical protein
VTPSSSPLRTFTPVPNAFGTAVVTVTAKDTGGTANDGRNASLPQTFLVTVNAVNDAPTFTRGSDVTVLEDSAAYSAANFLTDRDAVEAGQTITSTTVSNDKNALFAVQPAIDGTGELTFTPAADAYGTAVVTVALKDDGGRDFGGEDTTTSGTVNATDVENDPLT